MTLRHLLVHVDESEPCAARLELAIDLARRFDARLTGLFAENDPHVMTVAALDPAGELTPAARAAETNFREGTEVQRLRVHWQTVMAASDEALIRQTVAATSNADVAILGQHDPGRHDIRVPADFPEQVILHSGRPVPVVPYAGHFKSIGRRVLIAWNGSREAARALNDALPFLDSAEYVILLAINPEPKAGRRRTGSPRSRRTSSYMA